MTAPNVGRHTPGPWHVNAHSAVTVNAAGGSIIASCQWASDRDDREPDEQLREQEANARLIADAPTLLDVARESMSIVDNLRAFARGGPFRAPSLDALEVLAGRLHDLTARNPA